MPKTYDVSPQCCRTLTASEYLLLVSRLSKEELECLSHCLVFTDCVVGGNCEIQNKVSGILEK